MINKQHQVAVTNIEQCLYWLRSILVGFAVCTLLAACDQETQKPAGNPEKVTIAILTVFEAALTQIAYEKGYFRDQGLEVTARWHPYGKFSLQDVLEGKADFATTARTPIMLAIMNGEKVSILATIDASQRGNAIVARRDRGIHDAKDLKGKKIATAQGTTSDYFLHGVLILHGIAKSEVEIVDMPHDKMVESLEKGEVDAIAAFANYAISAKKRLAAGCTLFMEEHIQTFTYHLVAMRDYVRNNPKTVEKLLRALVRAEEYARRFPEEAQRTVADYSRLELDQVKEAWPERNYRVNLDQTLLPALEEESRWAIKNKLCRTTAMPNYLDYIYLDGLRSVKPNAARILN